MKRKIISVMTTFVLILSSHFSMIYALNKPHLNLNEKEDSVEVTLNLPKVENGLEAVSGKIDYDQNKLELVKVKQVSKKLKTPQYNEINGKFILLINSKTINESVDAVCFTFKVKEDGDTTVKVTELTGATSKDQKITLDDTQTVLSTDKKTNSSDTSKDDKQTNVKSDKNSNKEVKKSGTVSANKANQKTAVTEENKKDTNTNKTTSSEDKTSSKKDETNAIQENSKQKNKKEDKKDSNEKRIIVKKESMRPNILFIFIAVVVLMLLLLITRYRKK